MNHQASSHEAASQHMSRWAADEESALIEHDGGPLHLFARELGRTLSRSNRGGNYSVAEDCQVNLFKAKNRPYVLIQVVRAEAPETGPFLGLSASGACLSISAQGAKQQAPLSVSLYH